MKIPNWLSSHLSEDAFNNIENAIKKAELKTSGEIVPIIVKKSYNSNHAPFIISLFLFCIYLLLDPLSNYIDSSMWYVYLVSFLLSVLFAGVLSKINAVKNLFNIKDDQNLAVTIRAELEFYKAGLNNTTGATGILLFISMQEKRAVVLADKSIDDKMPKDTWTEVISLLLEGVSKEDISQGLCLAITRCGDILQEHFPIQSNDVNELKDHLIIKE